MLTLGRESLMVLALVAALLLVGAQLRRSPLLASPRATSEAQVGRGHAPIRGTAVSHDGRYLVAHSGKSRVTLRDAVTGELLGEIDPYVEGVNTCHTSFVAVSGRTGRVLLGFAGGMLCLTGHPATSGGEPVIERQLWLPDSVITGQFHPDGGRMALGTHDGFLLVLSAELQVERRIPSGHGTAFAVAYLPSGEGLFTAGSDGWIRRWDEGSGEPVQEIDGGHGAIRQLTFSADGGRAATLGSDMSMKVWDTSTWQVEWEADFGSLEPITAAISPDGQFIACGVNGGAIRVFAADSGRQVAKLAGHSRTVSALVFLADGRTLLSGGFDGYVRFWQVGPWAQRQQFAEDFSPSDFDDDD